MKRWIHSQTDIYAMSMYRDNAKHKIESLSEMILEHVCKCILYRNSTNDYHHWIHEEIATWLSYINELTVKPKDKKLRAKDYEKFIFGTFGDNRPDAQLNLELKYRECLKKGYSKVNITENMIKAMVDVTLELRSTLPKLLSSNNQMSKEDFGKLVESILDKHITQGEE